MKAIKKLSNKLFSIEAPGLFDFTLENKLTLYGQANQDLNSMGVPKFSLTLIRLADYGEASRKDLKTTFSAYALENCFKAEPAEQSENRLRGKIFYKMTAITDTKFQGTHYKLLYLFFLLPLNDVYGIQLHGFTPLDLRDKYENSFGEIWRSLQWETDREAMEAAWASEHPETSGGDSTGFEHPVEPFQLPEDGSELFQIGDFTFGNQYLFQGDAASLLEEENLLDREIYDSFEGPFSERWGAQHGVNVYGFAQHESPETQAALALKGDPGDWIILLKVSSAGDFQWGDAGDLFFVIHKSDLLRKDFSNVFITTESS